MNLRSLCCLPLALAIVSGVSSPARAQNAETAAQARFHEGMAFASAGDYENARVAFSQALAIRRNADTLWNLAIAEKRTHHEVEACRHIREYLRRPEHQASDEGPAKKLLDQMSPAIGRLRITAPAGATVLVDEQSLPERAPLTDVYDVTPGDHVVRATQGDAAKETRATATAGVETTVTLVFDVPPTPWKDGRVEPPKTEERTKIFPPPAGALILGGAGVVGLGLGIGFGLASQSQRSSFDDSSCATSLDPTCHDKAASVRRDGTIAWISYAAGGVLLAGGVVWWAVAPRKERVSVGFMPAVSPTSAAFQLKGTF